MYQGEVESLSDAGGRGVGVRAFVDRRWGYSYSTDLSESGLRDVGRAAREAAAVADADEWAGLPERCGATPVEGLASPELGRWTTEQKVELALAAERAARAHRGRFPGRVHRLLGLGGLGGAVELATASRAPTTPPRPGRTRRRSRARAATS